MTGHDVTYKATNSVDDQPAPVNFSSKLSISDLRKLPDIEFNNWTKNSFEWQFASLMESTLSTKCTRLSISDEYIIAEYVEDIEHLTFKTLKNYIDLNSISTLTDYDKTGTVISSDTYKTTLLAIVPVCFDVAADKVVRYNAVISYSKI